MKSQPNKQINETVLRGDKLFAELLDTIDLTKLNKSEIKKYQASKLTYEDVRPFMSGHYEEGRLDGLEQGMQRGLQQGLQKGLHQGMQQEKQQTAFNALKEGLPLQTVSKITNLPISELEAMKNRL
ncbi:MAG: hypothetical protein LBR45_01765 [Bacteroidales bacterium]|jgi:predicted transposase/invertase (TIGR01784 family)|nr:hypothetical protein [Bacteroidales bacterium]